MIAPRIALRLVLTLALAWACFTTSALAADAKSPGELPQILEVAPARSGDRLTCHLRTANLPGERIARSMQSGLPSAIEMALDVLDPQERVVTERTLFVRLGYDLWEETFRVQGLGDDRDFATQAEMESYLSDLRNIAVSPLAMLAPYEKIRLRVGMRMHPLAPRESEMLEDWVSGEGAPQDRGVGLSASGRGTSPVANEDGREVLVSLGKVIRYFFKGSRRGEGEVIESSSAWFSPAELREAMP